MPQTTVIHIMRHGEVANPDGVLYERLPGYHLSDLGKQMAQKVADYFVEEHIKIGAVVTSPLERAIESGTPTARAFGLQIETDPRLIESVNSFRGERINANRLALAHPRNWKRYLNPLRPSWGEPYRQQAERMVRAVGSALHKYRGKDILLVSHQLPIWTLRRHLEGKPLFHDPRRRECSLASLTTLVFEGNALAQLLYNEPAKELLQKAADMTPGASEAAVKR